MSERKIAYDLGAVNLSARGDQRLYRMNPPLDGYEGYESGPHEYVVASAVCVFDEPETYLFPADKDGNVTSWGELPGSLNGTLQHEDAIAEAGYEVVK